LGIDAKKYIDENGLQKVVKINNFGFVEIIELPKITYKQNVLSEYHKLKGNYKHFLGKPGYYLYYFHNPANNSYYFGITKKITKRLCGYVDATKKIHTEKWGKKFDMPIVRALIKYGFENLNYNIVAIFDNEKQAYQKEIEAIQLLKKWKIKRYNRSPGGKNPPVTTKSGIEDSKSIFKTNEEIENIFKLYHIDKLNSIEIAKKLKCGSKTIRRILCGKVYSNLTLNLILKYGKIRTIKESSVFAKKKIGENHHNKKIKDEDITKIINEYYENNLSLQKISKIFNVGQSCIRDIVKGLNWKHISESLLIKYQNHPKFLTEKRK
jgi:transposase/predicted GIY-YIG superfamily endonuclease